MPSYTINLQSWANSALAGSSVTWENPANAENKDGSFAVTDPAISTTGYSCYLLGTEPTSFSPSGSEVLSSLQVTIWREGNATSGYTQDLYLYLWDAGAPLTAINMAVASNWPTTDQSAVYTLTAAELATLGVTFSTMASSTFGVGLACHFVGDPYFAEGSVDAIILTVNTVFLPTSPAGMGVLPSYGVR